MRPTKGVSLQQLDVDLIENFMIRLSQGNDTIVIHPVQAELVVDCIRAVLENVKQAGRV